MLSTGYNSEVFSKVVNFSDFFNSKLPEIPKLKSMINNIKIMYSITNDRILLECSESDRIYKITFMDTDTQRTPLGWFVYLPKLNRLDLYSPDSPAIPLIQWKDKRPRFKNYSRLFDRTGIDKLFSRIVTVS